MGQAGHGRLCLRCPRSPYHNERTILEMTTNWTKNFLAKAQITDDPSGDLIADMRRDSDIPRADLMWPWRAIMLASAKSIFGHLASALADDWGLKARP
jgi:hypothetical protein